MVTLSLFGGQGATEGANAVASEADADPGTVEEVAPELDLMPTAEVTSRCGRQLRRGCPFPSRQVLDHGRIPWPSLQGLLPSLLTRLLPSEDFSRTHPVCENIRGLERSKEIIRKSNNSL